MGDTETPDNERGLEDTNIKRGRMTGKISPFLLVDGFTLDWRQIESMVIDMNGPLPKYQFTILDKSGAFGGMHLIKSDIIASLYIKSSNEENYKPVRNDIYITKITPAGNAGSEAEAAEGKGNRYTIHGILFVPNINNRNPSKAYSGSSKSALTDIAKDLNLGFVTNEDTTKDDMNWLKIGAYYDTIHDIAAHSYKNEESFYTWFIDQYYCLNFVNLSDMLVDSADRYKMWIGTPGVMNFLKSTDGGGQTEDNPQSTNLFLSNHSSMAGTDIFISGYNIKTNQGEVFANYSYKHNVTYYDSGLDDDPLKNFVDYAIHSYETYVLKNESIRGVERFYYGGVDYNNGHDQYIHAGIFNRYQMAELDKINLVIQTNGINYHILRGMRIPVMILRQGVDSRIDETKRVFEDGKSQKFKEDEDLLQININNTLTGFYVVKGIKYIYNVASANRYFFSTEITLSKTKWDDFYKK